MTQATKQLDQRFATFAPLARGARPPRGWLRAIREALGMTTTQFARRLGITQPSAVELEKAEASHSITLRTLERAAEALDCRVVYVLVPNHPLEETLRDRAQDVAERKIAAVEQTMRLEDQSVTTKAARKEMLNDMIEQLLRKPARLWDDV
jgi:predicted DNA-binding mobile mystery protein A